MQRNWPPVSGLKKHTGTDTIEFILHKYKPKDRRATYLRAVFDIRTHKTETHRTRLTAEGNLIDYPGEVITPTSDLTTTKIHVNSAILDVKSRYMCMDVNDFLPEQPYGWSRIYNDTYIHQTTIVCGKIQPQVKILQWAHRRTGN